MLRNLRPSALRKMHRAASVISAAPDGTSPAHLKRMNNFHRDTETADLTWAGLAGAACVLACVPAAFVGLLNLL